MITEFNIFENNKLNYLNSKFWKILINDDLLPIRLFKIGMNDKLINDWVFKVIDDNLRKNNDYIYIGRYEPTKETYYSKFFDSNYDWSYCEQYKRELFDNNDYEYMGELEITKDDIDEYKIKNDSKKYNI